MTCADLLRWLDEGRDPDRDESAGEHAAGCAACAREMRAADAIEAALASGGPLAPAGFTARVMAQVESELPVTVAPALPWWTRVAGEPATVMALLAAGLLVWGWDVLWALAAGAATWFQSWVAAPPAAGPLAAPRWMEGLIARHLLETALACLALFYSQVLYRWASRLAHRRPALRGWR